MFKANIIKQEINNKINYTLGRKIERDAGGGIAAVLHVSKKANAKIHDGHKGHARVENAIPRSKGTFVSHFMVHGQHERDAFEGINGRAKVDGPVVIGRHHVEFAHGLERAVHEQLDQYDAHRKDHEKIGERAEWS